LDYAISSHAALSELFKSAATKTCGSYFDHPAFFKGDSARSNLRLEAKQLSAERGKARTGNLWHPLVAVENHVALFALGEKHAQSPTGNSKNPAREGKNVRVRSGKVPRHNFWTRQRIRQSFEHKIGVDLERPTTAVAGCGSSK
jgi:hypothetical protein